MIRLKIGGVIAVRMHPFNYRSVSFGMCVEIKSINANDRLSKTASVVYTIRART